jgi:hypothetical protein
MKPWWCTFHLIYWESRACTCFENYLLILRRRYTNCTIAYICSVIYVTHVANIVFFTTRFYFNFSIFPFLYKRIRYPVLHWSLSYCLRNVSGIATFTSRFHKNTFTNEMLECMSGPQKTKTVSYFIHEFYLLVQLKFLKTVIIGTEWVVVYTRKWTWWEQTPRTSWPAPQVVESSQGF